MRPESLGWHGPPVNRSTALRDAKLTAPHVRRDSSTRSCKDLGVGCVLSFSIFILALLPNASPLAESSCQQHGASWHDAAARKTPITSTPVLGAASFRVKGGDALLRLRGGKSGRRRKCAGLRRGGRVRKKDAYLRRKRDVKRDEERLTAPLKGRGGMRKVLVANHESDSDDGIPEDLDLLSMPVMGGGVKKRAVAEKVRPSPEDEARFQKAWEEKRGHGDGQLMVAIKFKRLKEARRLLDAGSANPNAFIDPPDLQRTLLHQAVLDDDLATAELLCLKGADLFALDHKFVNPTKLSMRRGNIEMFSLLQSWGGVADPQKTHLSRR